MRGGHRAKTAAVQKTQAQIRMTEALKQRIRKYQQQVRAQTGFNVSFSSAVRTLIEKGLEAAVT